MLNHSTDSKNNGFKNNRYDSKTCNKNGFDVKTFATNEVDTKLVDKQEIDKDTVDKNEMDKIIFDKNGLTTSTTLPQGPIRQSEKVFSNLNSSQSFDQLLLERRNMTKDVGGSHSSKKF